MILDFGGLNEDENPYALQDHELTDAFNVWRRGRTTGTRPGTIRDLDEVYDADIAGTPRILGKADFRRERDTSRNLVVAVAGAIHTSDTDTLDAATNSVVLTNAAGNPWVFAQHKGILYGVGGDLTAGTPDDPWYWDPSVGAGDVLQVLDIQNLSGSQVRPRWIFAWKNRLYAGGFEESDLSAGENIVRYSALNDGTTWPLANTIGGTSAVGGFSGGGDEYTTGMSSYQDNEDANGFGLILTNRKIYAVQETGEPDAPLRISDEIPNGCVSHHAYVNLGLDSGDGIYLSEHGIHSLRQSQRHGTREDKFLSFKIRPTFRTINRSRLDQAVGAYWREVGLVLFAVPTGANTTNDLILALDMRDAVSGNALEPVADVTAENARWHIWRLADDENHAAATLLSAKNAAGEWKIYGGNYKGQVFEFAETTYADMGVGYQTRFRTKDFDFQVPHRNKVLGNVYADIAPGGDYQPRVTAIFDRGVRRSRPYPLRMPSGGSEWGSLVFGVDTWGGGDRTTTAKAWVTGHGKTVAFEFSHVGTNEPFYVAQLAVEWMPMGGVYGS